MQTIVVRCVAFIVFLNFTSFAENWPGWRGSLGMGKAEGENYPTTCSRDKNVLWRIDLQERGNSSQICENGIIVAMGVRAGGAGDVSATHQIWTRPWEKQRMGFGVLVGGHVYILNEDGVAQCIEARQGKVVWEKRLRVAGGNGKSWSSMVVSGDHLYAINKSGGVEISTLGHQRTGRDDAVVHGLCGWRYFCAHVQEPMVHFRKVT